MRSPRVAILVHERDARAERSAYLVWSFRDVWRSRGIEVETVFGPRDGVEADVVVNHVDATVVPDDHRAFLARFPVVVNGRCLDISKRRVSTEVLSRDDPWDGPVIVKTDANCGGIGEERLERRRFPRLVGAALAHAIGALGGRSGRERARWTTTRFIPSEAYPVFPSRDALPTGILENRALVVERFVPEREGDLYALRTYFHLGQRAISRRVLSTEPIVKAAGVVRREDVEPPAEVLEARARFGLDFGKIDYVIHDGRVAILDVNRTPSFGSRLDEAGRRWTAERLAPGIDEFLGQGSAGRALR